MKKASTRRGTDRQGKALDLLDREREILLNGPLSALGPVVARREALLADILDKAAPGDEVFLEALKTKAERNGRLLLASLAGLRVAQEQIEEAEEAARTLRTYTATGASVAVSEQAKRHDQRR